MNPKKKSLQRTSNIFLLTLFVLVSLGATFFIRIIIVGGLNDMEDEYAKQHIALTERGIQEELNQLEQNAKDYAVWNDSCDYLANQNRDYEAENLTYMTFENLDLDMIVYADKDGRYVYAKGMDENRKRVVPIYEGVQAKLEKYGVLTNLDINFKVKGLVLLEEGLMMISSHPIIAGDGEGPVRGNLILGRFFNQNMADKLGKNLNLNLIIEQMNREHSPEFDKLTVGEPIMVESNKEDRSVAYAILKDVFDEPAAGIIINMDRKFSQVARNKLILMRIYFTVISILLIGLISYFFNSKVLSRIKRLSLDVSKIMVINAGACCLADDYENDEISIVNDAINSMLMKVGASQDELKESEEKYRKLVESGRDVVFIADLQGAITYVSPNCKYVIGYSDDEIIGQFFYSILHFDGQDSWRAILQKAGDGYRKFDNYEFLGKAGDGTRQWFRMDISVISNEGKGTAIMGIFYNIHEKKIAEFALIEAQLGLEKEVEIRTRQLVETNENLADEIALRKLALEKIERLAYFDFLTGLPNRVMMMNLIQQEINLAKRTEKIIGFLFLDLDSFKTVNDTLGHTQGDELLKAVAARLLEYMGKDAIVARMGGDEFIIMVPNLESVDQINAASDKVIETFRQPFELNQNEVFVTASIGMSVFPLDGETHETLIKNADLAMYKAKEKGKNQSILCTASMKELIAENMKVSNDLYRALEKDELEVYYQPQVSLISEKIVGLEALLRWNHPKLGMVYPGKFIHLAEQTGLINPIGKWVMHTACVQNKAWQEAGLPFIRVAVNLSVIQFQSPGIVEEVRSILAETKLSSDYLELEITESIAMRDTEYIIKVLNVFREMGLYISIDDFGTEFSSLKYLKLLPINRIKIPMPFIQGIDLDDKDEAITKAIIILAKNMGLEVIAEGVETKRQQLFLIEKRCDQVQGFYYYKPMTANDVERILRNEHI